MKKRNILFSILVALGFLASPIVGIAQSNSQSSFSPFAIFNTTITPKSDTWNLKIPALSSSGTPCLTAGSTGLFATTTCGSSGGTSTPSVGSFGWLQFASSTVGFFDATSTLSFSTTTNALTVGGLLNASATASTIAGFDPLKNLISLNTSIYPSLTELAYVKGVTSAIQTQLNTKGTFTLPSLTSGSVLFSNGTTIAQDNTNFFWDDTNNLLGVGTNAPSTSYRMDIKSVSTSLAGLRVYGGGPTGGAAQIGSGEIRLGNGATDFGNIAYNNQNGNVYIDNGYSGGSIFLRVGGVTLLGTTNTSAYASAVNSASTGLVVAGGSTLENHSLGGEIRLGNSPGENVYLAYGASSGDFYLKNAYSGGKYRFYIGTTQHMTLFSTGDLSIGTTANTARLSLIKTTEQLRVGYDASNYFKTTVGSIGGVTFDAVGSGASFTFSDPIIASSTVQLKGYTVATLPTGVQGMTAYVTDATAPTYLGTLTGGGAVVVPVFFDGSAWISH